MSDWSLLETQWVQVSETDAWALGARPARASDAARASGRVRIGQRYERPTDLSVSPQSQLALAGPAVGGLAEPAEQVAELRALRDRRDRGVGFGTEADRGLL